MLMRFFLLLTGFGLAVAGGVTIIAFLNLLAAGHGIAEFGQFIVKRPAFYLFLSGMLLVWGSLYWPMK